ncbi:hypothetical protein [Nocardioides sp. zg-DK7169]|uniref:hypothetical protein n=1 Tax=Nocardioides sp. zg-DK7169 TaxID=2736600 RepID=UPI001556AFD2|nr:hypothetical protein [Nocardioides sp. zg-DK7169]NPC98938.1 hypothetical protein [Nocardioides sp. zg-DK7169]
MLRTGTAVLCLVASLAFSGCSEPVATPVAREGDPERSGSSQPRTSDAVSVADEPKGLALRSVLVHGAGVSQPAGRATSAPGFPGHARRLASEFRSVWVASGVPGAVPGHDFFVTVTGEPSAELLDRVSRLPTDVEVLSGDLLTAREYAALSRHVVAWLREAGVADDVFVGASALGDALAVHVPADVPGGLTGLEPVAEALTAIAADLDAHAAGSRSRLAALRAAVPIRLYARSAEGDVVALGGVPAGPLP